MFAEKRVALVVGNGAYQHAAPLPNPTRDAKAITQMFQTAGFDTVLLRNDVGNLDFKRALRDFFAVAKGADIAVVFFAGHGIQIADQNYLIPVDARLAQDYDATDEAISLERIIEAIEPAARLRLVVLDACRDNPFLVKMQRRGATRQIVSRGLSKVEPMLNNTLIAYAAKAGSTAEDGAGEHSPFTTALIKHVAEPGLDIRLALGRVRDEVLRNTRNDQEPFVYGSLGGGSVSLVPPVAVAKPAAPAEVRADYELVERINTRKAWELFINQHKSGMYVDLARERLRMLEREEVAAPLARMQGENSAWDRIKDSEDPAAIRRFIERNKSSPHAIAAQSLLDSLERVAREKEEKAAAEEAKKQAEAKKLTEEKAAAEAERLRKAEEVGKQAEAERLAEEKAAAEAKRLAEEKAATEAERLQKAEEEGKQAEAKRFAEENSATAKPGIALPVPPPETRSSRKEQMAYMAPLPTVDRKGQVFQDCADCPVVVRIPGGSFTMGQAKGDASAAPQHTVTVRAFVIGQYPVTVGEWKACVEGGGCSFTPRMTNADYRTPVHNVSWDDAQQYTLWLSRSTGEKYRLPTEAEWEYAARAHTSTRYWWGDTVGTMLANCSDCGGRQDARTPLPVGSFKSNPFGLHDMHGGVAQWVADCWFPNYQGAPTDASARDQKNCQKRVLRGGSFRTDRETITASARGNYDSSVRYIAHGFRVARDLN